MIKYKNQTFIWGSSFVLSGALLTTVFNATNPEYNFPGITEALLIGVSLLLVANSLFLGKSLTRREWILGEILLALIGALAIRYLLGWSDPDTIPSRRCIWMPGYFAKLECLLQLPFKSHHGLRQLLFHFTALSVFLGVASLSRMSGVLRPWLFVSLAIPSVIISLGVLAPVYYDTNFSLVGFNFVYVTHEGPVRGDGIVANSSWLWPWLAPAMGICLATIFSKKWLLGGLGFALFALCALASLSVMQRGGYLIVGILITATILLVLYHLGKKFSKKVAWSLLASGIFGLGYFVYDSLRIMMIFDFLGKHWLGLSTKSAPLSLSNERLRMWDVAWEQSIKDNLWLGTGYGKWLSEFSKLSGSANIGFDTAHNLWVQLIFELGVLHVVVMAFILGLIVWTTLFYKNVQQPSLQIGGFFLTIGFLVASFVQEIDYILPVYMQFAAFAGLCFGGTSYQETIVPERRIHNNRPRYLVGCGIVTIFGALYYWSSISWGGYGYDPSQTAFSRLFRPKGVIATAPDRKGKDYSLYWGNLGQLTQESLSKFGGHFPDVWINGNTIYLKNGSKWRPRQYQYESQKKILRSQRITSFELNQPPGQTNVFLLAQQGMYLWELSGSFKKGIRAGRWCEQTCRFLLFRPADKYKPHGITIQLPLPGLNEKHPVKLKVSMQAHIGKVNSPDFKKLSQQILSKPFTEISTKKEFVFRHPEESYTLPVNFRKHQLWLISLKTDQTIIPKEHDPISTDTRKLGVRVLF